jgi:hypothetical protein
MTPYFADGQVTLFLGDCRKITDWLATDVLVTDPPYGRGWRQGRRATNSHGDGMSKSHDGIVGDQDTSVRDEALTLWGGRPAIVFGDPLIANPAGTAQVLAYAKPDDAGIRGAHAGFRRDLEEIYLVGPWPVGVGGMSSILRTRGHVAGPRGVGLRYGHPHAKPVDVMETLIAACPPGVIADPFAGSGSTLVAARNQGRKAIGVELKERYCELIVKRLAQGALSFEDAS